MLLEYIYLFLGNKSFKSYNNPHDSEFFKEFVSLDINICKRWPFFSYENIKISNKSETILLNYIQDIFEDQNI